MFRFTIRELVLLTVIVAMGLGWGIDRAQLRAERSKAISETAQALNARARAEREAAELESFMEEQHAVLRKKLRKSWTIVDGEPVLYDLRPKVRDVNASAPQIEP